jgi:hypothetical protein
MVVAGLPERANELASMFLMPEPFGADGVNFLEFFMFLQIVITDQRWDLIFEFTIFKISS